MFIRKTDNSPAYFFQYYLHVFFVKWEFLSICSYKFFFPVTVFSSITKEPVTVHGPVITCCLLRQSISKGYGLVK